MLGPFLPTHTCPPLCYQSFKYVGTDITWVGEGVDEYGHVKGDPENVLVRVDPRYFRPTEVELLLVSKSFCFCVYVDREPSLTNLKLVSLCG